MRDLARREVDGDVERPLVGPQLVPVEDLPAGALLLVALVPAIEEFNIASLTFVVLALGTGLLLTTSDAVSETRSSCARLAPMNSSGCAVASPGIAQSIPSRVWGKYPTIRSGSTTSSATLGPRSPNN